MHEVSRIIPEKPEIKHIVIGAVCILLFTALAITALFRYYTSTRQTWVIRAQDEAELSNGGHEFSLVSSARTFRHGYALLKSIDGSDLYVVAVTEKAPLIELYHEKIFVMNANNGGFSELGNLVINGQMALADETMRSIDSKEPLLLLLCVLFLAASIVNIVIMILRYRRVRSKGKSREQ